MEDYKSRLNQLQEKLIGLTKKNINLFKHTSKQYKKLGTSLCIAALLTTSVHTTDRVSAESTHLAKLNVETIYHVYVDNNRIGAVDDNNLVDQLISNKINKYSNEYSALNLVVGENVKLIPEVVFNSRTNTSLTLAALEENLTIKAEATALKVDGEAIAYVSSEEEYEAVLTKLKLQYVSEEQLLAVLNAKENNQTIADPAVGERVIKDVRLSKDITVDKVPVYPKMILSVDDAVKQLILGTLEDDVYVVEPGDVLGAIAQAHGLSMQDILALNPSITENTLLQIGDKLNVTIYEPVVKVIIEEATKIKEEIPFQTETKEDKNMWRGDTKVLQAGQAGERVVSYNIARENGRTIQRQIVSENITKEPQTRIVVKGTKVATSRGTGRLAWPAVGGYISSYQGMRWGRFHRGIDIARPTNRNILAADNGTVSFAGWDGGYGNKVMINHNNGMTTLYAHLSSIDVRVGQTVSQGQKVGVMGSTGNSTGVHLHFEVLQNGKLKNPMDFLNR
ncbi:M23 family peptidase [Anaerobacillus alkaliphilus]|uniref:M23 family peptidase n=1 Tax=Anaerobacillus alkaliphilus TaxID=1548597 RepID=A0A4Q0VY94_9BACI|nr:M23 family metallopeptidase [Anaerobacillus alkaliphilus]RXJ02814.1 M23 family peptidase [Anaerobacillus alkaliphilus]